MRIELRQQRLAFLHEIVGALVQLWHPVRAAVACLTLAAGKVTERQLLLTRLSEAAPLLFFLGSRFRRINT